MISDMKIGQYHYSIRGRAWKVYRCVHISKDETGKVNGYASQSVKTFALKEDARRYTWMMNGWGVPKKPLS